MSPTVLHEANVCFPIVPLHPQVAKGMLTSLGLRVDSAWNGLECIDLCAKTKYDVVFLDLQMPVCDGYKTIKRYISSRWSLRVARVFIWAWSRMRCAG